LWNQIKASVLGLPYVPLRGENFTCWGAAMVAGAAVGAVPDLAEAALAATAARERVLPDPDLQALYSMRRTDYLSALDKLLPRPQEVQEVHA